ncbi:hypothetical protein JCM10212_001391 [Sporobolomyces blumeae]
MSASPPAKGPPVTFVSAMDFTFSDDEVEQTPPSTASSTRMGTPAVAPTGNSNLKGRMTGSATSRMNARATKSSGQTSATSAPNSTRHAASQGAIPSALEDVDPASLGPGAHMNPLRQSLQLPRAPPLDFSTIRTSTPRLPNPPPRPRGQPRKWGLDEAPVYHPSVAEFADPMDYIEKIAPEAKQYGICKIVPPEGWRPPFAIDTETFRFKTRLQQLNSMEASARASLNFLEQLYLFHRQHGSSGMVIPSIMGKAVDLWRLKREVGNLGGYFAVTNNRQWTTLGKAMGYNVAQNTGVCSQLKTAYFRIIVPFEEYVKKVRLQGGPVPPDPVKVAHQDPSATPLMKDFTENLAANGTATPKPSNGAESLATPKSEPRGQNAAPSVEISERVRTASDRLNEVLEIKPAAESNPGEACEICGSESDPDHIVLCDDCDKGFHLSCLSPPLRQVPNTQFYCDRCLMLNGADYGFEEGQTHSLYSFRRRADAFKRKWLENHPLPLDKGKGREGVPPSGGEDVDVWAEQIAIEDHFEREFWRLVESPNETVEVEYGADVNSSKDGAGFPNLEVHPLDPYSRDGWNLNNLPILGGSLLRYIKSDISGMTIPWIYVGMVFSTFAWHKEDHYTYSINYHHLGDTKTWYGIPGEDDEKLEAAMKRAAPELFDQQPDLLFQLVTLMSPGHLKKNGCRVYAADQRPNEFIITFPRAYHSGFNHGFNFNEAVNFALPDWIPTGLACIERYREIKKNPVFSHDELLITISLHDKNPRTSRWLLPNMREMVERELGDRERIRTLDPAPEEVHEPTDREEEEYQCEYCKTLCYLSQVLSADGAHIACPDHIASLPEGPKRFRLRYADADLTQLVNRVRSRSEKAGRLMDPSTGLPDGLDQPRTSGRKRKPSAALLEAAGEEPAPAPAPRAKAARVERSDEDGDEQRSPKRNGASRGHAPAPSLDYDANGDISVGAASSSNGDIPIDPSLAALSSSTTYAPHPPRQNPSSSWSAYQSSGANGDLKISFSPPRPAPTARTVYQ